MAKMPKTPRLNDTAALVRQGAPHITNISIREVSNGHIVCESGETRSGGYSYKETFSKEKPRLKAEIPPMASESTGNSMSKAISYAKK